MKEIDFMRMCAIEKNIIFVLWVYFFSTKKIKLHLQPMKVFHQDVLLTKCLDKKKLLIIIFSQIQKDTRIKRFKRNKIFFVLSYWLWNRFTMYNQWRRSSNNILNLHNHVFPQIFWKICHIKFFLGQIITPCKKWYYEDAGILNNISLYRYIMVYRFKMRNVFSRNNMLLSDCSQDLFFPIRYCGSYEN